MKRTVKSKLAACVLVLTVVCSVIVFAGDVIVKEGVVESERFQSTGSTASGTKAVAFGHSTIASGMYSAAMGPFTTASDYGSTAIGYSAEASDWYSMAMGLGTTASGYNSTAMGGQTEASGYYSLALGYYCTNNIAYSLAVGFYDVDLRVKNDRVYVYGYLDVTGNVDADSFTEHSSFYDKDVWGRALNYLKDSSKTIRLNAHGEREYDHGADPAFLQKRITVEDYDKYTDKKVWNKQLQEYQPVRTYQTHQELRSNLSMKVAWLRQCVFELTQENETLKAELAAIKEHVGME